MNRRTVITSIALAAVARSAPCQVGDKIQVSPEQAEVFALLDRFDPRDFSQLPFVKVATGWTLRYGNEPWQNSYRFGFLLQSTGREFVVRLVDGNRLRLTNTPVGTPEYSRVGFAPEDLRASVRDLVEQLGNTKQDPSRDSFYPSPRTPMSANTQALFLSRTCARLGLADELEALWAELPEDMRTAHGLRRGFDAFKLRQDLDARTVLDLGDPTVSWQDLLSRYEVLIEDFADGFYKERWSVQRDAVKAHLATARPDLRDRRLSDVPIEELIAALADVCRPSESGGFDSWAVHPMDPGPANQSVFDELVRRGLDAVPALIAHLGDKQPARSWSYCSRFGGHFSPLVSGDNALAVLQAIAGRGRVIGYFDCQSWYECVRQKGLRGYLIDAVQDPEYGRCFPAVITLLERFPDALGTVLETAEHVEGLHRSALLEALVRSTCDRAQPPDARLLQILESLAAGTDSDASLRAAQWLQAVGSAKGARVLVDRWDAKPLPTREEMEVLLRSGDVAVWETIESHLAAPGVREAMAHGLRQVDRSELLRFADQEATKRISEIVQRCLLRLLADQSAIGDDVVVAIGDRRVVLHTAVIADVAAIRLGAWWPDTYHFDPATTRSARACQIRSMIAGQTSAKPPSTKLREARPAPTGATTMIASVDFTRQAKGLPATIREQVQLLAEKPVVAEQLLATLVAIADCQPGTTAHFHLERVGGATGFTLACDAEPGEPASGSDFDMRVTAAGKTLARGGLGTGGRLDLAAFQSAYRDYLARLTSALTRPIEEGVEITLKLKCQCK